MTEPSQVVAPQPLNILLDGNAGAPRVLVFSEHLTATYVISFQTPMRGMHARGEVNLAAVDNKSVILGERLVESDGLRHCWELWDEQFRPDVVIFSRYALPFAEQIVAYFKSRGIPVVYHIDDNLMELPASLGADVLKRQGAREVVDARVHLMSQCDLIYASTAHLAGLLSKRFEGKPIFHGVYASYLGDRFPAHSLSGHDQPVIGYMGSKGHQEDLALAVPAIARLLTERPGLRFEVFGTIKMPVELQEFGERVRSIQVNSSYDDFLVKLASLGWTVGLAPLVNEPFNLCKAPTKFIEYTSCGIPVVASNISVYANAMPAGGGLLVDGDWHAAIASMLDDAHLRSRSLATARAHCSDVFSLARLESQVAHALGLALAKP